MVDYQNLEISNYIFRITGVFQYKKRLVQTAKNHGFAELSEEGVTDKSPYLMAGFSGFEQQLNKYTFYPEIRKLIFSNDPGENHRVMVKTMPLKIITVSDVALYPGAPVKSCTFTVREIRLDLFDDNMGLFTLDIQLSTDFVSLQSISDASFLLNQFGAREAEKDMPWNKYIEAHLLGTVSDVSLIDQPADYSGSKYKTYLIAEFKESENNIPVNALLFDLATFSRPGSTQSDTQNSMSKEYINRMMQHSTLKVYNNWQAICLLDSFMAAGQSVLNTEGKFATFSKTYFHIYIYALVVKYKLFKFNYDVAELDTDKRDHFQDFMTKYFFGHISYKFLPSELYKIMRNGLELDHEVKIMRERIDSIGKAIQETEQKRTNLILGIVSFITGLSSIKPVVEYLHWGKDKMLLSENTYWVVVGLIGLAAGSFLIWFVFETKIRRFYRLLTGN